jgi:hypothetical protein
MPLDLETRRQFVETIRSFVEERLIPRESEVAEADAMRHGSVWPVNRGRIRRPWTLDGG